MNKFEDAVLYIEKAIEEGYFPSAVLAIGKASELFVCEARGIIDIETREANNISTLYDMASLTKVFATTTLALKFIELGKISLSDNLGYYFTCDEEKQNINIFDLMTHTSGISNFSIKNEVSDSELALNSILNFPLAFERTTDVLYSDMGFILLGKVLEKVGEDNLDSLTKRYIFDPLDMNNTGFNPNRTTNVASTEYNSDMKAHIKGFVHDGNARFLGGISGHAGLFSDINDCIKFVSMFSRFGETGSGRFLSRATIEKAITNYTMGMSENRGLGFKIYGGKNNFMGDLFSSSSFGHTGFTGTSFVVDPITGLYAILLTNRVHPTRDNLEIIRFRKIFHNIIASNYN